MRALRKARRAEAVTAALVVVSLALLAMPVGAEQAVARRANHLVLLPVSRVRAVFGGYLRLREENAELRIELQQARLELGGVATTHVQNRELRQMLDFAADQLVRLIPARVVDRNFGTLPTTFLLDVGRASGIEENLPVVTAEGLVGKVVDVGPATSQVMLYAHPEFSASALVVGGDHLEYGIVRPAPGGGLRLFLPLRSSTGPGDPIVTSGYGGTFPRGIAVGRVVTGRASDRLGLQKVDVVQPVVDLGRVTTVFVLARELAGPGRSAGTTVRMFWPGYAYPPIAGETLGREPVVADSVGPPPDAGAGP